jgi:hypothetical protein
MPDDRMIRVHENGEVHVAPEREISVPSDAYVVYALLS